MQSIDNLVLTIKEVEDKFVKYNFPLSHPKLEQKFFFFKRRFITYNGYDVVVKFNRSDFGDQYQETLQILSYNNAFLPFFIVKNIAQKFLGGHELYLSEIIKNDKKVYLWFIFLNKDGKPFNNENQKFSEEIEFENLKYKYVLPMNLNYIE